MSDEDWSGLLDRLEEDAERVLAAAPGTLDAHAVLPWTPPDNPLPAHLAERARRVVERQRAAMDRASAELDGLRQHLGAVRMVPAPRDPDAPAYLDVDG